MKDVDTISSLRPLSATRMTKNETKNKTMHLRVRKKASKQLSACGTNFTVRYETVWIPWVATEAHRLATVPDTQRSANEEQLSPRSRIEDRRLETFEQQTHCMGGGWEAGGGREDRKSRASG